MFPNEAADVDLFVSHKYKSINLNLLFKQPLQKMYQSTKDNYFLFEKKLNVINILSKSSKAAYSAFKAKKAKHYYKL